MRAWVAGLLLLLAPAAARAAEPLVVDPWLDSSAPPSLAAFEPLAEIVDPWAQAPVEPYHETQEIVDPWASPPAAIPSAAFPLLD